MLNMTELPHKYEVPVKVAEKAIKLTDQTKLELKASGMMDDKGKLKSKRCQSKDAQAYERRIGGLSCYKK